MSKTDKINNDSTITIDESLAHDHHSHNHSHNHNYNEIDPTLACVGKNCPHHSNMLQTSGSNSNGKEIVTDTPSHGIFA